jgi:hypothetical protein
MVEFFALYGRRIFQNDTTAVRRRRLLLAVGLLVVIQLSAQPKVIASLKPERIETGDTAVLLILISGLNSQPKDLDFGPWSTVLPPANIIRRSEWKRSGTQWIRSFTLIAFDSATLELPPLRVRLLSGTFLETNPLKLTVFPTRGGREITDMAKIRDIRREPETWLDYWPWLLGALLTLGAMVWWLRKNRQKPKVLIPQTAPAPPPILSSSEQALQKLTQLKQKQLWKNGQTKEHYAELSLILREYLETRFKIAALESTTAEIQQMLQATDFPMVSRNDLKAILEKTDLVKYAQSQPSEAFHEEILVKAQELVAPLQAKKPASPPKKTPPKSNTGKYEPL